MLSTDLMGACQPSEILDRVLEVEGDGEGHQADEIHGGGSKQHCDIIKSTPNTVHGKQGAHEIKDDTVIDKLEQQRTWKREWKQRHAAT